MMNNGGSWIQGSPPVGQVPPVGLRPSHGPAPQTTRRPQFAGDGFSVTAATRTGPVAATGIWDRLEAKVAGTVIPVAMSAEQATFALWNRLRTALGVTPAPLSASRQAAATMSPQALRQLAQTDKAAFFRALLPSALASQQKYGVPVSVTLAQAAIESGWAKSPIAGYNIFGIKGKGTAGSTKVWTTDETKSGHRFRNYTNFAVYRNFDDAVLAHGKLFHNGYYDKGIQQFAKDKNPHRFLENIAGTYANGAKYIKAVGKVMQDYNLVALAKSVGGT
jgi:flagellum-specific peptidoglycan hydrolase FlgJ